MIIEHVITFIGMLFGMFIAETVLYYPFIYTLTYSNITDAHILLKLIITGVCGLSAQYLLGIINHLQTDIFLNSIISGILIAAYLFSLWTMGLYGYNSLEYLITC